MARKKVTGSRPLMLWGIIAIIVVLVVVVIAGLLVIYPDYRARQDAAQATVQAQAQVEQHYQAGIAFQNVEDWDKALAEFEQVIRIDASYRDVQAQLANVKARQREATAIAQVQAPATATVQAQATISAQAAAATTTVEAMEAHYEKGVAYMNLSRWEEAKAELQQVFEGDPNYKEVQAKLAEVEAQLKEVRALTSAPTLNSATPSTKRAGSTYHAEDGAFVRVQGLVAEVVLSEFRFDDVPAGDVEVIATLMGSVERGASETGSAWIEINGVRLDQVPTHVLPRETLAHQLTLHGRLQNFTGGRLTVFIKASTEASTAHFKFGVENGDGRFGRHVTVVAGL